MDGLQYLIVFVNDITSQGNNYYEGINNQRALNSFEFDSFFHMKTVKAKV